MPAFTVTYSNKAAIQPKRRPDLDMHLQVCQATDRTKMALYEANLAAFELTTATRSTHGKFFKALLGEVERYQAVRSPSGKLTQANKEALCSISKQHDHMMQVFTDRDVYGQCVGFVAQRRVFN